MTQRCENDDDIALTALVVGVVVVVVVKRRGLKFLDQEQLLVLMQCCDRSTCDVRSVTCDV
jgi:uncharacterized membrane protein